MQEGGVYNRGLCDHTGVSDNRISFRHHSDITNSKNRDLSRGILTLKVNDRVGILTDKPFLGQNSLGQPGPPHDSH